jgi:hypothetical protein
LFLVFGVAAYFLQRVDFVEVSAVVTSVGKSCSASKTQWDRRSMFFRRTETHLIECANNGTPIAESLQQDGFNLNEYSQIWFSYRSPADDKMRQGFANVEATGLSVGDTIKIEASRKIPNATKLAW